MKLVTGVRPSSLVLILAGSFLVACAEQQSTAPDLRAPRTAKGGPNGSADPSVTGIDPTGAPQDTTLDLHVFGTNFDQGSRVDLALDGVVSEKVTTNSTVFVSSEELVANVTIALDADTALYDVVVTSRRGKKGIGTELFRVRVKGGGTPAWVDTSYSVTDLGAAPGKTFSRARDMAIAESGEILLVGSSWTRNNAFDVPTLWTVTGGTQVSSTALSMLPAWEYGSAWAVTSTGTAVGTVGTAAGLIAAYWDAGGAHELDLGVGATSGWVSDAAMVDQDEVFVGQRTMAFVEAVYWINGQLQAPLPSPATNAAAEAVNSAGTIAGFTAPGHPVIWHRVNGSYERCDLGNDVDNAGIAYGISEPNGDMVHVVGASDASEWYATVWTVDLATTDWGSGLCTHAAPPRRLEYLSEFVGANAQGDAVGANLLQHRATLLTAQGVIVELPNLKSGSITSTAVAVNSDRTVIAGSSQGDKKAPRAVLWKKK